jgi:hypothetical protein
VPLIDHSFYVITSGRITNAEESIADRTISDHLANLKVFLVMTPAPLWPVNIASRIVVLYALTGQDFCGSK